MKKFINKIGVMQGRICNDNLNSLNVYPSNPFNEFRIAKKLNLSHIELITENRFNTNNLIWHDKKLKKLNHYFIQNNLKKISLIDNRATRKNFFSNIKYYLKLIKQIRKLKLKNFILPLYNKEYLNKKNKKKTLESILMIFNLCKKNNINFLIETDLPKKKYNIIKDTIQNENFGLVFDTGNREYLIKNSHKDILAFNSQIKHVHLKDKDKKGNNVMLGSGIVNFYKIFQNLNKINYSGYFTLETTRNRNPVYSLETNLNYIKKILK